MATVSTTTAPNPIRVENLPDPAYADVLPDDCCYCAAADVACSPDCPCQCLPVCCEDGTCAQCEALAEAAKEAWLAEASAWVDAELARRLAAKHEAAGGRR